MKMLVLAVFATAAGVVCAADLVGTTQLSVSVVESWRRDIDRYRERDRDREGDVTSRDAAYRGLADYAGNLTNVLESPAGRKWLTVAEAIPWARRVWGVKIVDETCDPEIAALKIRMNFGDVECEMALPLFLQALDSAVTHKPDCYVVQDDSAASFGGFHNLHKGTVHIRKVWPAEAETEYNAED
jgi:hypothetical protein